MAAVILLAILLAICTVNGQKNLVFKPCLATQYFDFTSLQCYECFNALDPKSVSKVPDFTNVDQYGNALSCTCAPGYIEVRTACGSGQPSGSGGLAAAICPKFTCVQCPVDEAPTEDKTTCLPCAAPRTVVTKTAANGSTYFEYSTPTDGSTFLAATKQCSCGANKGVTSHVVERNAYTGTLFDYKKCMDCPSKQLVVDPATNPFKCSGCAHPNMTMDVASMLCSCTPTSIWQTVGLASYGEQTCIYKTEIYSGSQGDDASQLNYWSLQKEADYTYWPPQTGTYTTYSSANAGSVVFKHYLMEAASRCAFYGEAEDLAYCERLANLCTLTLYDTTSRACLILAQIQQTQRPTVAGFGTDWKQTVPFIVIDQEGDAATALKLSMTMSFDQKQWMGTYESLNFTLATYSLNGTFLGLEQLTDQFSWCKKKSKATIAGGVLENADGTDSSPTSTTSSTSSTSATADTTPTYGPPPSGTTRWLKHGTSYSEKYWCDLESLVEMEEPKLYDVYIVDQAASKIGELTLYPVPIRILNYRDGAGPLNNVNYNREDQDDDKFHRRMFLYDQVSGVSEVGSAPNVIRYADYIEIETMIVENDVEKIHVPVISVHYTEREIGATGLQGPMKTSMLEFKVIYSQNMESFWAAANWMFALCCGTVVILYMYRLYVHYNRNSTLGANDALDGNFFFAATFGILSSWTMVMFWYLWVMSIYWFFFYKVSTAVYCMLPDDRLHWLTRNDYYPFRVILGLCFVGQVCRMIEIIKKQCNIDIFLMDWETPRGKLVNPREAAGETKTAPISAWRTIFCANEWNEMQSTRKTDSTFTILFILFLFVGCDMQYVATPQPDINDLTRGDVDPVLRFAHVTLWFLIVNFLQLVWNWAIWERYVNEPLPQMFRDVCSIAKVSLFILDERYHGYYLHCCSPAPYADANMLEMAHDFTDQEGGIMKAQPIPDDDVNDQGEPAHECFEVYVTKAWRDKYDAIFTSVSEKANRQAKRQAAAGGGAADANKSRGARTGLQSRGAGTPTDQLVKASRKLNRFLRRFINKTERDHKREMRENNFLHRVCSVGTTPQDLYTSLMYGDLESAFTSVIIHGVEFEMLLFNILTWGVMDLWLDDTVSGKIGNNPVAAAFVTWLVEKMFLWLRGYLGSININKKTLVDDRFLL